MGIIYISPILTHPSVVFNNHFYSQNKILFWLKLTSYSRLILCPRKCKFFFDKMNLVDFIAIIPFYIALLLEGLEDLEIIGKAGKIIRLIRYDETHPWNIFEFSDAWFLSICNLIESWEFCVFLKWWDTSLVYKALFILCIKLIR